MSRNKKIISKEECAKFNSLRTLYSGKTLSRNKVLELLKVEIGWANNITEKFLQEIFIKPNRGIYVFPKNPVHINKFQNLVDGLSEIRHTKYMSFKEQSTEEGQIEKAISLLKANGYIVCKVL